SVERGVGEKWGVWGSPIHLKKSLFEYALNCPHDDWPPRIDPPVSLLRSGRRSSLVLVSGGGVRNPAQKGILFSSRRRHTRLVSDWSSDVCSSDLGKVAGLPTHQTGNMRLPDAQNCA